MKDLTVLQMEIFSNAKIAQGEFDKMVMKLEVELKDLTLNLIQRDIIKADIRRIGHLKHSLRSLELFEYKFQPQLFKEE